MLAKESIWFRVGCALALLAWCLAPMSAAAQGGTTYEVLAGDSLGYIAATYGTTVQAIVQANGLASADAIWPGQKLTIPLVGVVPAGTPAPSTGVPSGANTYTVGLGDTLGSIARDLGVSQAALAEANGITNPDLLWIGQRLLIPGTALGGPAAAAPAAPASAPDRYVVQAGDTLNGIAAGLGVSVQDLMQANDLGNADLLQVGQKLLIPGASPAPSASGAAATPPPPPVATPVPPAASTAAVAPDGYVVQPGDTLGAVAAKLGVTTADLLAANDIADANVLRVGQRLTVPARSPAAAAIPLPTAETQGAPQPAAAETPAALDAGAGMPPTATPPAWAQQESGQVGYTVQAGDTLGSIAHQFGTNAAAIARLNHLPSPDMISVGMPLMIPAPAWTKPNLAGPLTRFVASISQQRCWLYQGTTIVANWPCSTGRPGTDTHPGSYRVQSKMDKAFGSAWNIWMPYWLGIYWAGASEDGIHGIPYDKDTGWKLWEGYVGTPITYGCILLSQEHAKQLYDLAYIGMPVIVQP